jgi:glyoxylase-like metal-dependent hydrolase (beta-lactamase superfamily II)
VPTRTTDLPGAAQITPDVIQITYRRFFNCYLVKEHDGLTLVDTCPAGAVRAVRAVIGTLGAPLRRVLLTHAHADHVAGLDGLVAGTPGDLQVHIGAREAPLLAGDMSLRPGEPEPAPKGKFLTPRSPVTHLLADGELVGSLRAIATPGHTPGHMSFLDQRDRTLIAGDAVTTVGRVAVSGDVVWRWPFPARATWNKQAAIESAKRMRDERPEMLASGHGPPVLPAAAALEDALARL